MAESVLHRRCRPQLTGTFCPPGYPKLVWEGLGGTQHSSLPSASRFTYKTRERRDQSLSNPLIFDRVFSAVFATQWHIFIILAALLLLAAEAGYRVGLRHFERPDRERREGQVATLEGALLGLLGLLLGFTFAMAVSRFEARKQLVVDEANAIGTTWLRAALLGPKACEDVRMLLRDYTQARLDLFARDASEEDRKSATARSSAGQADLWKIAVNSALAAPSPTTALFIQSLNEMIDLNAKRFAAKRNQVPSSVWLLLMIVSATVCWCIGYATGVGAGERLAISLGLMPLLVTVVITIIADLDRPRQGLITVGQESMREVRNLMERNR